MGYFKLTVVLHEPQCNLSELKSAQVPEQQAGVPPVHGEALQLPQCEILELKSVQTPAQQAGTLPVHGDASQPPQWL